MDGGAFSYRRERRIGFILVSEPSAESFYERAGMQRYAAFFHPWTDAS